MSRQHAPHRLLVVLSGSSVSTMRDLAGGQGALYGRAQATIDLQPFTAVEAAAFMPGLDPPGVLAAYAVCGGYPVHLQAWAARASFADNLRRLAFTNAAMLVESAERVLAAELGLTGGAYNALAAIGRGRTRYSQIETDAGQRIERVMDVLLRSGFVRRSAPIGAPNRATPMYDIPDPYLRFYFKVLFGSTGSIDAGQGATAQRSSAFLIDGHIGWVYEEVARQHAIRLANAGDLPEVLIGRWWAHAGEAVEIDVVGLLGERAAVIGEASWSTEPASARDLVKLRTKAARLPSTSDVPVWCFWRRTKGESLGPDVRSFDVADALTP